MRRFTVLVIALVFAPGLHSTVIQTRPEVQISTLPGVIAPEITQLPGVIPTPELRPLPIPEVPVVRPLPESIAPELRPELVPEVEAVVPEIISINPCEACFEYMTSLIDQLTEVAVPEAPEVGLPEPTVPRPLPESIVPEDLRPLPTPEEGEIGINPLPLPVDPEIGVRPLPLPIEPELAVPLPIEIPSEAEAEESLAVQARPLPQYIIRK